MTRQKLLPFVATQASGGPQGYSYDGDLNSKYMSPIDKPARVLNKILQETIPQMDNILADPPEALEGTILEKLLKTTFEYGNHGKNEALQELNSGTNELSKELFRGDRALEALQIQGNQYGSRSHMKNLVASLKKARGGKEDLQQKNLIRIQYVFLGDIIEGILAYHAAGQRAVILDESGTVKDAFFKLDMQKHLILNNFELTDLGLCADEPEKTRQYWKNLDSKDAGKTGELTKEEREGAGARETTIQRAKVRNIADIPIALETLSGWWINNVVRKLRTTWTIGEFLNSVMTQLIPAGIGLNATNGDLVPKPSRSQVPSLNIFEAHLNARSIFDAKFISDRRNRGTYIRDIASDGYFANTVEMGRKQFTADQSLNNIVTDKDLEMIQKASTPSVYAPYRVEPQGHWESKGITDDAVTMMIMSILPVERSDLTGNERTDAEAGVWHFRLARDGGPILSYSFSRNEIPYLAEANVFSSANAAFNDSSSGISYNISLKMLGNQILQPGSTMYIDLLGLGFGNTRNDSSLAYMLNIGGYYVVKSVKSHFSPEGYFTEVEGVWQKTMIE